MERRPSETGGFYMPAPGPFGCPAASPRFVVASFISLAPPCSAGLAHSAAPPLPTKPTPLGFRGDPVIARSYLFR